MELYCHLRDTNISRNRKSSKREAIKYPVFGLAVLRSVVMLVTIGTCMSSLGSGSLEIDSRYWTKHKA